MNIFAIGTTDDPVDSLEYHKNIKDGSAKIGKIKTKVAPSFRPDNALNILADDFKIIYKSLKMQAV